MDSSSKARAILGRPVFTLDELEVEDRLRIVEAALKACKPYFKYLTPEFESIDDLLNIEKQGYSRKTNKDLVSFSDRMIYFRLRCIEITTIKSSESKTKPTRTMEITNKERQVLLLSQKGNWIIWSYKMRVEGTIDPENQTLLSISETIEECEFKSIDKEAFQNILSITPGLVYTIIDILYLAAYNTVEEGGKRLRNIERARDKLSEIKQRIKT